MMMSTFSQLLLYVCIFGESVCSFCSPFVDGVTRNFVVEMWVLYRSWLSGSYLMYCVEVFPPIQQGIFSFSFAVQKLFHAFPLKNIFVLAIVTILLKTPLWSVSWRVLPMFSSKDFIDTGQILRCLFHSEFTLWKLWGMALLLFLTCGYPVFLILFVEDIFFSHLSYI